MKVELLVDVSDERRSYRIGEICDLPDGQAAQWMKAGFVRVLPGMPGPEEPEAATLEPEENAAMPRARKR
jgi:hypothetical protein